MGKMPMKNILLKMYKAIAVRHTLGVFSPRNPNSKPQHRTQKVLTIQRFQLPKSARLPIVTNKMACPRKVKPLAMSTTDVYALVLLPPPQNT